MNYYLDLTLIADGDINLGFLWQKVYQQTHLMLVENKVGEHDSAIALSFPLYGDKVFPLGNKLRFFGQSENALSDLNIADWFTRLEDYVHIKAIKPVPDNISDFVVFKRKQFKSPDKLRGNIEQRAKEIANKNNFEVGEVKQHLLAALANYDTKSKLPFITLESLSSNTSRVSGSKKSFKLFIEKEVIKKKENSSGLFTCYGLSRRDERKATVPWF